jgi:hypothetical protein
VSAAEARRRIRAILTAAERERIVDQGVIANPLMRGAGYDDILEMAWDTDSYVSATEPFFDVHRGWPEGAFYAAMVICAQGRPLTQLSLLEIMTRAGLMPGCLETLAGRYHEGDLVEFPGTEIDHPKTRQGMVMKVLMPQNRNPMLVLAVADMPDGITLMRQAAAVRMLQPAKRIPG